MNDAIFIAAWHANVFLLFSVWLNKNKPVRWIQTASFFLAVYQLVAIHFHFYCPDWHFFYQANIAEEALLFLVLCRIHWKLAFYYLMLSGISLSLYILNDAGEISLANAIYPWQAIGDIAASLILGVWLFSRKDHHQSEAIQ